ncbi:hypothetical protein N0V93_008193 [Gnomoniopsis smithogilvyi]|uniref:SMP-30/Gluconolactonase/LRE-like region domain-containing protein n=1 Tax=Gnomoniopsis smithogilvyi TaxID=1191159 RepID=A0A9W8YPV8_9PEZI|nr:hypothetical protein N0V93_008193 [Gnomoniopsis smithogilvyi]
MKPLVLYKLDTLVIQTHLDFLWTVSSFIPHRLSSCIFLAVCLSTMAPAVATQIFAFASFFIENLHVLPNGKILLITLNSPGLLYSLDPNAENPESSVTQIANLPDFHNINGVTGIAPLGDGLIAITGGIHTSYAFQDGSMHLYIVSLMENTVIENIAVPGTSSLNGLAALNAHTLLSADSIGGRIIRIDTLTKAVSVVVESEILAPGSSGLAIGINGLKVHGNFVYFTNSNLGIFGRLPIDEEGNQVGAIEVLARSTSASDIYDDFTFDSAGNAYVAVHSSSVFKITPEGVQTLLVGDAQNSSSMLTEPTSVAMANDGTSIYVSTGGGFAATPRTGGQVVQIKL